MASADAILNIIISLIRISESLYGKLQMHKIKSDFSLKERELDLYRNMGVGVQSHEPAAASPLQSVPGASYGLRAYQNGTRSPYVSAEIQRPRPMTSPNTVAQPTTKTINPNPRTAPSITRPKTANIDSMKFLESMTKIYEKNGRSDLAQGLKTNMKKAKMNLA